MAQRAPFTQAEKQLISQRKATGESLVEISRAMHCSYEAVRKWWRIARDERQVRARGRPKRGPVSTYPTQVSEKAIELKQKHAHWGPKRVKLELKKVLPLREEKLPSVARLSVLFKQRCPEAVQPRQRHLLPPPNPKVFGVHQRWQMDAKEGLRVGSERVNVQEIRDIYSGLMIISRTFVTTTLTGTRHLTRAEHQQALRQAFCQWGLPLEVQTDNDGEFVNPTDPTFPSPFTLWLVGLGITHITSRPHRPTDQPQVERNHRTQGDFVWKDQSFAQVEQFQQALDEACHLYNTQYPSQAAHCQGSPPLSVFPTAIYTGRPYHYDLECDLFDLKRVDAFLTDRVWTRKVASNSTVHLGGFYYILGKDWTGQTVSVRFLPASRSFRFDSALGEEITTRPAQGVEKDHLIGTFPAHLPLPVGFQFALPILGV
jgi:transposase InsO family protein